MSQWPPSDPSPQPRDPALAPPTGPPRVDTYQPDAETGPAQETPTAPTPVDRAEPAPAEPAVAPEPLIAEPASADSAAAEPVDDAPHTTEPPAPLENLAPPPVADYQTDYGHDGATEDDDPDGDETVFELNDLSMEQRRHLEMRLTGAKVVHRWEVGSDLVVNSEDADAIEAFLDEVEHPDGFGEEELEQLGDLDEDVDDEAVYKAMSDLYVAADRLQHAADDAATAGAFHLAADGVTGAPPPFGFDPRVWEQVKGLSSSLVAALNADADPEVVERDAHSLRQILANFV